MRWLALNIALLSSQTFAFSCYLTVAKDSCWTNYNVNIIVLDGDTAQQVTTLQVPKGQSWSRKMFSCQPGQNLTYKATFNPGFWQGQEDRVYNALRYWSLPPATSGNTSAWEIPVCYPAAFAGVPFPPDAAGNCICDFKSIPAINPALR